MDKIKIKLDDKQLQRRYKSLSNAGHDLRAPMAEIGQVIMTSVQENFESQGRYSTPDSPYGGSNKWKPLAPATIAKRQKAGHWPGQILRVHGASGGLSGSITSQPDSNSVTVGPNKVYDAIQHFGGKAGRNKKVTIPARPYMVAQDEDIDEVTEIIRDHLIAHDNP